MARNIVFVSRLPVDRNRRGIYGLLPGYSAVEQGFMNEDMLDIDKRLDRTSLIVTLIAVPVAFAFLSSKAALSLTTGAVLSYINFHWLKQAVDFVILHGAEGNIGRRVIARYAGRYALIGLVLYVTLRSSALDLLLV